MYPVGHYVSHFGTSDFYHNKCIVFVGNRDGYEDPTSFQITKNMGKEETSHGERFNWQKLMLQKSENREVLFEITEGGKKFKLIFPGDLSRP